MSGKSLIEAAKAVGLTAQSIAAVDAQGRDAKGAPVDLPDKAELLRAAFASDVGVDEAPLNTKDGGFVWFDITKVDPAHDLTFEEAKPEVEKQWRAEEVDKALAGKADDLVKQIKRRRERRRRGEERGRRGEIGAGRPSGRADAACRNRSSPRSSASPPTAPGRRRRRTGGWCSRSPPTRRRRSTSPTPASRRWPRGSTPRPARACSTNMSRRLRRTLGVVVHPDVLQSAEGG